LALKDYLLSELQKEQEALKESIAFNPVEDYPTYREVVGQIRAFQRLIRIIEDLPDE
jgi:hypothetical protein